MGRGEGLNSPVRTLRGSSLPVGDSGYRSRSGYAANVGRISCLGKQKVVVGPRGGFPTVYYRQGRFSRSEHGVAELPSQPGRDELASLDSSSPDA